MNNTLKPYQVNQYLLKNDKRIFNLYKNHISAISRWCADRKELTCKKLILTVITKSFLKRIIKEPVKYGPLLNKMGLVIFYCSTDDICWIELFNYTGNPGDGERFDETMPVIPRAKKIKLNQI